MQKRFLTLAALVPMLAACEDTNAPDGAGRVAVRFQVATQTAARASASLAPSGARFDHVPSSGAVTLTGTNGTLVLRDIRMIVAELELERSSGDCTAARDGCADFEGGPFLVDLLDGTSAQVATANIPAGRYTEFEFEVENLDPDEDDDAAERRAIDDIWSRLRQAYPSFPRDASMVVHGTFAPTGGAPQAFTVYFDAEIEVEKRFATPLRVPEDDAVLVNLDPALWLKQGNQVVNLLALNGRTIEFELEIEKGIEVDRD